MLAWALAAFGCAGPGQPGLALPLHPAPTASHPAAEAMPAELAAATALASPPRVVSYTVVGDAIPAPLTGMPGDPLRGRAVIVDRRVGLCLLCHSGPFPEERFQGTLAPDLGGAGQRWSAGQLRLRLADSRRLNPDTLMPAYHRVDGLAQVGSAWQGKPLLTAQQIEDVIALLVTLRP